MKPYEPEPLFERVWPIWLMGILIGIIALAVGIPASWVVWAALQ